jgi:hypothetical protein
MAAGCGARHSAYIDLIGEDRKLSQLHYRVLGELLGIVGTRAATQHEAQALGDNLQVPNPAAKPALNWPLSSCKASLGVGSDRVSSGISVTMGRFLSEHASLSTRGCHGLWRWLGGLRDYPRNEIPTQAHQHVLRRPLIPQGSLMRNVEKRRMSP